MNIDWEIIRESVPLLAEGMIVTLQVSALSAILGLFLGIMLGLAALSKSRPLRWLVAGYVDFIRGTPLLIQIFLVFFVLPSIGIRFDEFWAGVFALSLNAGAFVGEVVRGGVGSIERGQTEAAMSIGMRHRQVLVQILLPQAYRQMIPPLTNEMISLVKNSSLLSVISVYELTRAGQAIISVHFVPFEIYTLLALYYYVLIKALSWLSARLERRLPAW
ncbi:MAG: His/Glu/Gln/Arg/opine family amino acid ABC transporter permease subunit [Candidatus Azotimanducaceae bacterium]|jgi:His/Glu/Gln/Arg/opine family amino acid ABC transporter permease subunit